MFEINNNQAALRIHGDPLMLEVEAADAIETTPIAPDRGSLHGEMKMKTWVRYTLIGAIYVAVIGGTTFGVQRWAYSQGIKEIKEGGPSGLEKGLSHLKLAPALRTRNAAYEIGQCYWEFHEGIHNWNTAVEWFQKAVERGNVKAATRLGIAYRLGWGVPMNSVEAMKWTQKAADQGDNRAQGNFGLGYLRGEGVPKNPTLAATWYQKAADKGDAEAQCNLGVLYEHGEGVLKAPMEAVKWYRKAADQGSARGQMLLGMLYFGGKEGPRNVAEAEKWFQLATDQGDSDAKEMLEMCKRVAAPQESPVMVQGLGVVNDSGYPRIRGVVINKGSRPVDAHLEMDLVLADGVVVEQFFTTCYQVSPGGSQLIVISIAPKYANTHVRLRNLEWR